MQSAAPIDHLGDVAAAYLTLPVADADTASVLTSSTYSSVRSDDAPSLFDSGSSIRAPSDTSSARGSIISNVSARTAKFLGRKSHGGGGSGSTRQSTAGLTNDSSSTISQCDADAVAPGDNGSVAAGGATKQKGIFECGFCKEENLLKTCTRKNDLKRHIEDFHNMNAQWQCRQRGCGMVFDWQTVYKTHLKHAHGGSRMALDDAKVTLCPQTVFGCGFDNCIQVFEAPSDAEVSGTFKEYVAHVIKHLDEGSNSGDWSYSTRMRNLMRQSGVLRAWTNSSWPESDRNRLTWDTQSSNVLRKRLETRHLGDLRLLVQYAIALGSNPASVQEFHETFILPVQDKCQMQIPGHVSNMGIQAAPPPPPPHPQPQAQAQAQSHPPQHAPPEQDPFSFKISRGTGTNPHLANYYASQRHQMFTPRTPVRSGRSARPPTRTMPASTMPPQQSFQQPAPNMFDPGQYYQQQHHHQAQPQQYQMMTPSDGGIIADDLRSLRSIASSTGSSADVDMSDAQMLDSSAYMAHQQDFSSPYVSGALQSPAPSDAGIKMEQPTHFDGFGQNGY